MTISIEQEICMYSLYKVLRYQLVYGIKIMELPYLWNYPNYGIMELP